MMYLPADIIHPRSNRTWRNLLIAANALPLSQTATYGKTHRFKMLLFTSVDILKRRRRVTVAPPTRRRNDIQLSPSCRRVHKTPRGRLGRMSVAVFHERKCRRKHTAWTSKLGDGCFLVLPRCSTTPAVLPTGWLVGKTAWTRVRRRPQIYQRRPPSRGHRLPPAFICRPEVCGSRKLFPQAARWCSGHGVGLVIEVSRVRFPAVALPWSLQSTQPTIPPV